MPHYLFFTIFGDRFSTLVFKDYTSESFFRFPDSHKAAGLSGLVAPKVEDRRAMVDCIMIDTAYHGEVFNIVLADIPEKKTDLVSGKYQLPALEGQTTIAVKITDRLGEEVLATIRGENPSPHGFI